MELGTALTVVGLGAPTIVGLIIAVFKWSLSRNVKHDDDWRDKQDTWRSKVDDQLKELPSAEWRRSVDEELRRQKDASTNQSMEFAKMRGEVQNAVTGIGGLQASLSQLMRAVEESRDKQAQFYREELQKAEQVMRQELSRHVHPDIPERVAALEAELDAASEREPRRPVRRAPVRRKR